MRHVIPVSGKDSCATAIVQTTLHPDLPYELFFTDVGCELPETYAWLDKVERTLGRRIVRVGESLTDIIDRYKILPSLHVRFCTREGKIEPMERFVGGDEATVYFGIRADEDRIGFRPTKHNIVPKYPLKEVGIDLPAVYSVLKKHDLKPPSFFWTSLHDAVLRRLTKEHSRGFGLGQSPQEYVASLPTHVFDALFAWRSRSNCYFCFFQSPWELVGLLEHHPDLFDRAQAIEERLGNDKQETPYYWLRDTPLSRVRRDREEIKRKRVDQVVRFIKTKKIIAEFDDVLAVTSCGLFCGK